MIEKISDFILNLLPGNNLFFIYYLAFIFLFSLLIIFYFSKRSKNKKNNQSTPKEITLKDLLNIASNDKSTSKDLIFAINYFAENFKVNKDEKASMEFFKKILNHKNRNKKLFEIFHGVILPHNLKYKNELNKIEKEALNNKVERD